MHASLIAATWHGIMLPGHLAVDQFGLVFLLPIDQKKSSIINAKSTLVDTNGVA
jgi:hypothetical protein